MYPDTNGFSLVCQVDLNKPQMAPRTQRKEFLWRELILNVRGLIALSGRPINPQFLFNSEARLSLQLVEHTIA